MFSNAVYFSRLIEVVYNLQPDSIGWSLRNPSGDRLRKLGNVKKVLEAAKSNGLDLGGWFLKALAPSFFVSL